MIRRFQPISDRLMPFVGNLGNCENAPCIPSEGAVEWVLSREVESGEPRKVAYQ